MNVRTRLVVRVDIAEELVQQAAVRAPMLSFAGSDPASGVTGQILNVCGGTLVSR